MHIIVSPSKLLWTG